MQFNNKFRIFGLIIGVLVLVGLVGVMALTVQRAQQLTSTITRPKAECFAHDAAGSCTKYDNEGPAGCSASPPACCDHLGSEYGGCSWDGASTGGSRGWCSWTQCGGAPLARSAANGGNQNCGLFRQTYCMSGTSCSSTSSCANGLTCRSGVCVNDEVANPCWTYQPIPKSWSAGNLSWDWDTTYATANWAIVYVWTNSGRSGDAYAAASANASSGYKSVNISGFSPALQPGTTYYVKVNPNSYNSPDAAHQCMDSATKGWMFATPVAPVECTADSACAADKKCESNKCVAISCTTAEVCKTATIANHACTIANKTDGTACETGGKTCQSGVCTAPSCPTGQTMCGGVCKNLSTDPANCGACGTTCITGKACSAGVCTLSCSGSTPDLCGSACTNKQTDVNNCGACGTVCTTGKVCSSGVCTTTCSGTTPDLCGTACTNKQTDSANCGACGTACTTGQTCTSGSCVNNEANVCWGNGGTGTNAGRCYDCNGDGTVNILDFSCFRLNWLKPVQ